MKTCNKIIFNIFIIILEISYISIRVNCAVPTSIHPKSKSISAKILKIIPIKGKRVISDLRKNFEFNSKLKNTFSFESLKWDGEIDSDGPSIAKRIGEKENSNPTSWTDLIKTLGEDKIKAFLNKLSLNLLRDVTNVTKHNPQLGEQKLLQLFIDDQNDVAAPEYKESTTHPGHESSTFGTESSFPASSTVSANLEIPGYQEHLPKPNTNNPPLGVPEYGLTNSGYLLPEFTTSSSTPITSTELDRYNDLEFYDGEHSNPGPSFPGPIHTYNEHRDDFLEPPRFPRDEYIGNENDPPSNGHGFEAEHNHEALPSGSTVWSQYDHKQQHFKDDDMHLPLPDRAIPQFERIPIPANHGDDGYRPIYLHNHIDTDADHHSYPNSNPMREYPTSEYESLKIRHPDNNNAPRFPNPYEGGGAGSGPIIISKETFKTLPQQLQQSITGSNNEGYNNNDYNNKPKGNGYNNQNSQKEPKYEGPSHPPHENNQPPNKYNSPPQKPPEQSPGGWGWGTPPLGNDWGPSEIWNSLKTYTHYFKNEEKSKTEKVFEISIAILSFLAFGGYLLMLIYQVFAVNSSIPLFPLFNPAVPQNPTVFGLLFGRDLKDGSNRSFDSIPKSDIISEQYIEQLEQRVKAAMEKVKAEWIKPTS